MADRAPWVDIVVPAIPVILAPIVAATLARRGEARRASELEALQQRTDLVDKLRTLRSVLPRDVADPLPREVDDIVGDLEALRLRDVVTIAEPGKQRSHFASAFLLYRQASRKASFYKGLFYFFTGIGILASLGALDSYLGHEGDAVYILIGALFYIGVGLAFRAAAVRDYSHHAEKQRLGEARTGLPASG